MTCEWPLGANLLRLLPGTIVFLLLLWRARQGRGAWLILLSVGLVLTASSILRFFLPDAEYSAFHAVIWAGMVGLAGVCLLSNTSNGPRMRAYFRTAIAMLFAGVMIPIFTGFEATPGTVVFLIMYGIATAVFLAASRLAAVRRRPHRSRRRALLVRLVWFVATAVALTPAVAFASMWVALASGALPPPGPDFQEMLLSTCLMAAILGASTYALVLPFFLLSSYSAFFRQRVHSDFRLVSLREAHEGPSGE